MAHWIHRLPVAVWRLAGALAIAIASFTLQAETTEVISPDIEPREIKIARIDNESIEINLYAGIISIEDFDASVIYGFRLGYHLNEHVFVEASYGEAEGDKTSFEEIIPNAQLLRPGDRDYISWDVSLGYNAFPNESWLFGKAFVSDVYLLLGAGRTEFGGDDWFTVNIGAGYRLFLTDWLIYRLEVRDHMFSRDLYGEDDRTNNIEFSTGLSVFF